MAEESNIAEEYVSMLNDYPMEKWEHGSIIVPMTVC